MEQRSEHQQQALAALRASRDFYKKAFDANCSQSWGLVQNLALIAVLQGPDDVEPDDWRLAKLLAQRDLSAESRERRTWAHSDLIELYLLAMLRADVADLIGKEAPDQKVREHLAQFLRVVDLHSFEVHSTRRQLLRYLEFFNEIQPGFQAAHALAEEILEALDQTISLI